MSPLLPIGIVFIVCVILGFFWIYTRVPERSAMLTGLGIGATFTTGLFFVMLIPSFNQNWSTNTAEHPERYHAIYRLADVERAAKDGTTPPRVTDIAGLQPDQLTGYTAAQLDGRRVYQREGCMYCHTQQIRPLQNEMLRYSIGTSLAVPADAREYLWDQPHFLGTRRIGPDLSRVGGKYSDDWHYSHFYYPRQLVPGSVMPAFTWLFTKDADRNPVPTKEMRDLVAYIQTLGFNREVYDPTLNGGKGGWRSWLKPEDQQASQGLANLAVVRAATPVHGGDIVSPTNLKNAPPTPNKH